MTERKGIIADPITGRGDCRSMEPMMDIATGILRPHRFWRHKQRGTFYEELGRADVQASTRPLVEGDVVVVYRGQDGKWHVRRDEEMEDGRFEGL